MKLVPRRRNSIELDPRRCFSAAQRAEMFLRSNGHCDMCGVKITGDWTAGHVLAWSLGGKTDVENGRVECPDCAKGTHADDTRTAAKQKRRQKKTLVIRPGDKFGDLTVIERSENQGNHRMFTCKCACGKYIDVRATRLSSGQQKCCRSCATQKASTKHGHAKSGGSRTYRTWKSMLDRCKNSNHPSYKYYGGKGVQVCASWLSFENFLSDMGERPDECSLDRIDGDGHYTKENCRWATAYQQNNNLSKNRLVQANGKTQTVAQWARETGMGLSMIYNRLYSGMSEEDAINTPHRCKSGRYANRKKNGSQIKSRNTLGGDEYQRRKAWAEKARKE